MTSEKVDNQEMEDSITDTFKGTEEKYRLNDDSSTFARIGEALVQAQTRARESQAHAQRCERYIAFSQFIL